VIMNQQRAQVLDTITRNDGAIDIVQDIDGRIFHRARVGDRCRYAEDRWQAEIYLDQLLAE